ncbi:MAG TPA: hypothetical protein VGH45_03860 [Solirubrobacteraceae bacterium]|jgi:5-methyltetrahydropteroyltriglutamate--homocysteine methyltransferase
MKRSTEHVLTTRTGSLPRPSALLEALNEHPQLVSKRLVRYAQLVGRENLIAGSDCGFATFASMLPVDPAITWEKLRAMADGAELASAALW